MKAPVPRLRSPASDYHEVIYAFRTQDEARAFRDAIRADLQALQAERDVLRLRVGECENLLLWMNAKGGMGLDVHGHINNLLTKLKEAAHG